MGIHHQPPGFCCCHKQQEPAESLGLQRSSEDFVFSHEGRAGTAWAPQAPALLLFQNLLFQPDRAPWSSGMSSCQASGKFLSC